MTEFENYGGEGGIRTPVPVTRQDAFEAPPLRPLRYLSVSYFARSLAPRCALGVPLRGTPFQPSLASYFARSLAPCCALGVPLRGTPFQPSLASYFGRSLAPRCALGVPLRGTPFQPSLASYFARS